VQEKIDKTVVGVRVEEISQGGWAALGRMSVGDIIIAVDNQPVQNVSELKEIMQKIAEKKPELIVLRIKRGIQDMFIELETDWSK
jgi:serine protease Do